MFIPLLRVLFASFVPLLPIFCGVYHSPHHDPPGYPPGPPKVSWWGVMVGGGGQIFPFRALPRERFPCGTLNWSLWGNTVSTPKVNLSHDCIEHKPLNCSDLLEHSTCRGQCSGIHWGRKMFDERYSGRLIPFFATAYNCVMLSHLLLDTIFASLGLVFVPSARHTN